MQSGSTWRLSILRTMMRVGPLLFLVTNIPVFLLSGQRHGRSSTEANASTSAVVNGEARLAGVRLAFLVPAHIEGVMLIIYLASGFSNRFIPLFWRHTLDCAPLELPAIQLAEAACTFAMVQLLVPCLSKRC